MTDADRGADTGRYPRPLRLIHWSIAALVVAQLALAVVLTQLRSLSFGQGALHLHQQFGIAVLLLVVLRMALAMKHAAPAAAEGLPSWQHNAAAITHRLFLALLIAQPLIGITISWARGDAIRLLGLIPLPVPFEISDSTHEFLMTSHIVIATLLFALVVIHVGAVLFNRLVRKVPVLDRMLPPTIEGELRNRMPVAAQMTLAFGLVMAISLSAGVYSIVKYREVTRLQAGFQAGDVKAAEAARSAQVSWKELIGATLAGAVDTNAPELRDQVDAAVASLDEAATSATPPELRAAFEDLSKRAVAATPVGTTWQLQTLREVDSAMQDAFDNVSAAVFQARTGYEEQAARGHDLIVVSLLPTVVAGVLVALMLARSLVGSLERMRMLVGAVAAGRTGVAINVSGAGEFSTLLREMLSMNRIVEQRTADAAARHATLEREQARLMQEARDRELATRSEAEARDAQERERQLQLQQQMREREAAARAEMEVNERHARERQRSALALEFEAQMENIIRSVSDAVAGLRQTATGMASTAAEGAKRSSDASAMAQQSNEHAAVVATGTSQLTSSAEDVRVHAEKSKADAVVAVNEVTEASASIDGLRAATEQISSIAEIIADIARQTTLLGINARIEAARAGEAGRGFAIVANEVKDLAGKTRQATEQINSHLGQVGDAAQRSVEFLRRISARVENMGASATGILLSAEVQAQSTLKISGLMGEISQSSQAVVARIREAQSSAGETEEMSSDMLLAADEMAAQTRRMRDQVAQFVLETQHGSEQAGAQAGAAADIAPARRRAVSG
jgi:methyl-accepting chemotaxis protein/cytochrome b561